MAHGRTSLGGGRSGSRTKSWQAEPVVSEVEEDTGGESSEEADNKDRNSVVRTASTAAKTAHLRDFGIGDIRTADSVAYLERKKSSVAASFGASARRKRSLREARSWKSTAKRLRGLQNADGAMWIKVGLPLFILGALELIRMATASATFSSGDGKPALDAAEAGTGLSGSILIGISLSVAASCMNALGLNLQRLGQNETGQGAKASALVEGIPLSLNVIGIALSAASGLTDLISFGFAPQSLLAPFGAMTLLVNLVLAPLLHNESLSALDVSATALICVGIAIALMSSPSVSPSYTLRDLEQLVSRPVVPVFLGVYVLTMVAVANHIYQGEANGRGDTKAVGAGYPVLSGMIGGLTTLSAKFMTELFKVVSLQSHPQLLLPVIGMLAICAVSQAQVLNRGVGRHSSLFVVPLFSASILLSNLSGGGVVFNEFSAFKPMQLVKFLGGVAIVVTGVTALATKEEPAQEDGKKVK
ncbi:Magnesium transporter NIPA2 [Hondaea fermentalgiana]|uniref:Magnesium transporter NIPA2 n=1 Tax=Hondaea fermentalgiana TaxID=2315210 RepID=A0A2R5G594_9STRA|nr:Magnesium transporter NIPA2 [Hondaea fermentalgiana]|eukprot:GBG24958.1 Magnesium transporter NIPA2 [Hondaea fermentalgiana]